jgi:hypothetical protein
VDFTNKSNNEGIDAAKQLLRKLMDEPTEPRPVFPVSNVQSPQPEADHSAELKADANRLARQRAEAINRAREQEQQGRTSQVVPQAPPPIVKNVPQQQAQKSAAPKRTPMIIGAALILLLLLGGGAMAWWIFNPPHTITPSIPTTKVPIIVITTEAPPEPVPTTPAPPTSAIPSDAVDFIYFYFDNINNRNYDLTWSLLSDSYKAKVNKTGKGPYIDFWNNIINTKGLVTISNIDQVTISEGTTSIVKISSNIQSTPLNYYLVWDSSQNTWLFNPMPESIDVSCSSAPQTLSAGNNAEVVTASDNLLLRSNPIDGTTIEAMPPGTLVYVLDGPECNYYRSENRFFWWWIVESPLGNQGWIVEGSDAVDPVFVLPWP